MNYTVKLPEFYIFSSPFSDHCARVSDVLDRLVASVTTCHKHFQLSEVDDEGTIVVALRSAPGVTDGVAHAYHSIMICSDKLPD